MKKYVHFSGGKWTTNDPRNTQASASNAPNNTVVLMCIFLWGQMDHI